MDWRMDRQFCLGAGFCGLKVCAGWRGRRYFGTAAFRACYDVHSSLCPLAPSSNAVLPFNTAHLRCVSSERGLGDLEYGRVRTVGSAMLEPVVGFSLAVSVHHYWLEALV